MKRAILSWLSGALLLGVVSCSPQAFSMAVDMRQPSRSGLDLAGKSFAVVYLQNGDEKSGEFNANFANGFAEKLEDEYFGGHRKVALYSIAQQEGAKYASKDTLVNLVMDLNADVIFLVGMPAFGTQESEEVPFHVNVFAYDSMNRDEDKVYAYTGSNSVTAKDWETACNKAGYEAGNIFAPQWETERFSVIYFDGGGLWEKASAAAAGFQWSEAIDCWLQLADTDNVQRRSCAEYNLALGCFMEGQYQLALEWLDRSDADMPVYVSKDLRSKIKKRMK